MNMINIIIVVLIILISSSLFSKAAGTINVTKLNIISVTFYMFFAQTLLGGCLLFLNFDKHYTFTMLKDREAFTVITITVIFFVSVFFPMCMICFQRLFHLNVRKSYRDYLEKDVTTGGKIQLYVITLLSLMCIGYFVIFIGNLGYFPLLKLLVYDINFNYDVERIIISNSYFISRVVKNIVFMLIPLLSYIAFSFYVKERKKWWLCLFLCLLVTAICVKTLTFAKTPIVFYLVVFYLIYIYHGNDVSLFRGVMILCSCVSLVIIMYLAQGKVPFSDIYNGVLGRTLFTQVGALSFHLEHFPQYHEFLSGRSLSPSVLRIVGIEEQYLRSGAAVMEEYGSESVQAGTAGVMSTFFIGEAYANFGVVGILASIVWVSLYLVIMLKIMFNLKKTPINIAVFAFLSIHISTMTQGGFFDFLYSFSIVFIVLICFLLEKIKKIIL